MKKCSRCKNDKELFAFSKCASNKDGYQNTCKICRRDYYIQNYSKERKVQLKYYKINEDELKAYSRAYQKNNKTKINIYKSQYELKRRRVDINFKLSKNIRSRMSKLVRGYVKAGSAVKDMGCTLEEFKLHLQGKFTSGMSWDNYGKWHIDHIRPLSSFNLQNRSEFLLAVHYTNLQPLWCHDNLKKSNKFSGVEKCL